MSSKEQGRIGMMDLVFGDHMTLGEPAKAMQLVVHRAGRTLEAYRKEGS